MDTVGPALFMEKNFNCNQFQWFCAGVAKFLVRRDRVTSLPTGVAMGHLCRNGQRETRIKEVHSVCVGICFHVEKLNASVSKEASEGHHDVMSLYEDLDFF